MYYVYVLLDDGTIVESESADLDNYGFVYDLYSHWYRQYVYPDPSRGKDNSTALYKVVIYRDRDIIKASCPLKALPDISTKYIL